MKLIYEELTRDNLALAQGIRRQDVPEAFVDTADTIWEITEYGAAHGCIGRSYIVKADDTCIGILLLGEALPWETDPAEMRREPFYRLMGFVIDERYRSHGLGGQILEEAIAAVYRDFGRRSIALGCHRENTRAAAFYLKHGFRRTGVFEGNDEYFLREIPHQ